MVAWKLLFFLQTKQRPEHLKTEESPQHRTMGTWKELGKLCAEKFRQRSYKLLKGRLVKGLENERNHIGDV